MSLTKIIENFKEGFLWTKQNGYYKLYSNKHFLQHQKDFFHESIARSAGEVVYLYFAPLLVLLD